MMRALSKQLWRSKFYAGRGLQWFERFLPFGLRPSRAACHSFTYFFRDVADYREQLIALGQAGGNVEILSVGCATGQESFSVAMLCAELGIACTVTGIDLSTRAIAIAERAVYDWEAETARARADLAEDPDSGADEALRLLDRCGEYFAPIAPGARERQAQDELRALVRFQVQDICDMPYENRFHLILCRKMLYYLPAVKRRIGVAGMLRALRSDVPRDRLIFDGYTRKQPFFAELWADATHNGEGKREDPS